MLGGDMLVELLILAAGVLGYFKLRQEHASEIETMKVNAQNERDRIQTEITKQTADNQRDNQKLIRETLAEERAESLRKDRSIEQLTQDNARHTELRAESETKAEERSKQIIVLERQLGNTINKAIDEAKSAERERVKAEMLEKQVEGLTQEREELRGRVGELEAEVKIIPSMQDEIAKLQEQVAQLMEERAQKDKEIDQLKAAVHDAA